MTAETTHPQYDVTSPENLARRERGLEVARSVDGEAAPGPSAGPRLSLRGMEASRSASRSWASSGSLPGTIALVMDRP